MWENIAGDMAGDALLGGAALCQRKYLRRIVAMHDPHCSRDTLAAGGQRRTSKKGGVVERTLCIDSPSCAAHHLTGGAGRD